MAANASSQDFFLLLKGNFDPLFQDKEVGWKPVQQEISKVMKQVAFVTHRDAPEITVDDQLTASVLEDWGVKVSAAPWDEPGIDWGKFDVVILRSCWNYHLRVRDFRDWIKRLSTLKTTVLNPPQLLLWNMHKGYLQELSKRGVPVFPTVWLPRGSSGDLNQILIENRWDEAILKPAISAGAHQTYRIQAGGPLPEDLPDLLYSQDMMVQQLSHELITKGELSLIFFGRRFSHMIRSLPAPGDFRVQPKYSGTWEVETASQEMKTQALRILQKVDGEILYARIDGVTREDGTFVLSELELIEPSLMLADSPGSAENFAYAISTLI